MGDTLLEDIGIFCLIALILIVVFYGFLQLVDGCFCKNVLERIYLLCGPGQGLWPRAGPGSGQGLGPRAGLGSGPALRPRGSQEQFYQSKRIKQVTNKNFT